MNDQVACGAQLLDEKIPDWYRRIDVGKLNLSCAQNCICGQLAGEGEWWTKTLKVLFGEDLLIFDDQVASHGFCADWENRGAWIEAINARLAHDALEPAFAEELVLA